MGRVNYARVERKQAFLFLGEFGLEFATKKFGPAAIAALPKFKKGKNVGKPKAMVTWQKVERGGWVRELGAGHVESRVGQIVSIEIREAKFGLEPEKQKVIYSWEPGRGFVNPPASPFATELPPPRIAVVHADIFDFPVEVVAAYAMDIITREALA